MYAIVKDGKIVYGPRDWNRELFTKKLFQLTGNSRSLPDNPPTGYFDGYLLTVVHTLKPYILPEIQELVGPTIVIESGVVQAVYTSKDRDLAVVKGELMQRIDERAEVERLKYITPGTGQSMTYTEKAREAMAFNASEYPSATMYPHLVAEVGITGKDVDEVALNVLVVREGWAKISAVIEKIRLGTKKAIKDAVDVRAAKAAYEVAIYPGEEGLDEDPDTGV